jgi:SAM-dependent methyltransferase
MMRVETDGFPAKLADVWRAERVRFRETLRRIPQADEVQVVLLDLGSSRAWLPFYRVLLGYREIVLNTSYPESGFVADTLSIEGADTTGVRMAVFDVERDEFPFADESFDVVLCLEVLEHLAVDPMAMMAEVNRVLRPGGTLVLSTPNAVRYSNVVNIVLGEQPCGWNPYNGFDTNRHNREYTPTEVERLLRVGGLTPTEVTTFGRKSRGSLRDFLAGVCRVALAPVFTCRPRLRNDVILATGTKTSTQVVRRPEWLYFDMAERANNRNSEAPVFSAV